MKRFALAAVCCILVSATLCPAVIYNWQTGEVIPGTEGITPGPGVDLSYWNTEMHNLGYAALAGANLEGAQFTNSRMDYTDLTSANLTEAWLRTTGIFMGRLMNANLTRADMTGAWIIDSDLSGANFSDAVIKGAAFKGSGLTRQQLYSTSSYQNNDLGSVDLGGCTLYACSFQGYDLAEARFVEARISYSDFSGANLTGAYFNYAVLDQVDFTDAIITGAKFSNSYFLTEAQIHSTASYKSRNMAGMYLDNMNLSAWDLHTQNLSGSYFNYSDLTGTDFSLADLRGARLTMTTGTPLKHDTIWTDGSISRLQLTDGEELWIRNYDMVIIANDSWTMVEGAKLKMVLEGNWKSVMNVGAGVTPDLGGTLELAFAEGVDIATLIGTEFKLFNWNGMLAAGDCFDSIATTPGAEWDTSRLYTDGVVTLTAIPEPLTLAMMALGGVMVRRRKTRQVGQPARQKGTDRLAACPTSG